jgi:hypothetical protein
MDGFISIFFIDFFLFLRVRHAMALIKFLHFTLRGLKRDIEVSGDGVPLVNAVHG